MASPFKVTPGPWVGDHLDADILIWTATQITEALDRGGEVSPVINFHPYALLKGIRRHTGGDQYKKLLDALRRLHNTSVETNIRQQARSRAFHWIEEWGHQEDENGRPIKLSITLPKWLYDGSSTPGEVLTIHPTTSSSKAVIERWLYRVARKHAGSQDGGWRFTMGDAKNPAACRGWRTSPATSKSRVGERPA